MRTKRAGRSARRSPIRLAAGIVALTALVAPLTMVGPASADTGTAGYTTTAATPTQSNVAAPNAAEPDLTGLSNGDAVTITVSGPAGSFFGMEARQCRDMGAASIEFNSEFVPDGGNCIDVPFTAGTDYFKDASAAPTNTTATLSYIVGTGTRTWFAADVGTNVTVTCDAANPCDLWIKEAVPAGINGGINWVHYDLTFASVATAPDAPTAVTAAGGDTTGTVNWTAPANTGNRPLDRYTVTVTPTSPAGPALPPQNVDGTPPATSATFTGLTNGTTYSATVTARNTAGLTSPASSAATFTPNPAPPPAPTNLSATPGDGQATLTWNAPASGPAPTGYRVEATPAPATGTNPRDTGSAATSYVFTGLTNGTAYTFTVAALYGATPGAVSASSAPATPSADGGSITQTVTVVKPRGALVLTQLCGARGATTTGTTPTLGTAPAGVPDPANSPPPGGTGYPYPTDADGNSTANYPTNCSVNMGTAKRIPSGPGAGTFLQATGFINQVTVVDERDDDIGWSLTGTMGQFTSGPGGSGRTIPGSQLGWQPLRTSASGPAFNADGTPYIQNVTAGPLVGPGTQPGTGGLQTAQTLASAPTGQGIGTAKLDADLSLWVPVRAKGGTYTGTLTITLA